MKKKLGFKILLNIFLVACIVYFVYDTILYTGYLINMAKQASSVNNLAFINFCKDYKYEILHLVFSFLSLLIDILFIIIIDFKDIKYLSNSLLQSLSKKEREKAKAEQNQKRIEALEKELQNLKNQGK